MSENAGQTVAIVGAGVAGLATARALLAQGLDCTLFERTPELGGVWAAGYANFGLQVQSELYEFPDWPLPDGTPDFTPGPIIQDYLNDFADRFGISSHIRLDTAVIEVSQPDDTAPGWVVTSRAGESVQQDRFDLVVICIGLYSNTPNMPDFPGQDGFRGEIMHISDLKTRDQLAGKRVAVLGYGKSATDAAVESAAVAAETHIIIREPHWPIPPKLAGILPFKWGLLNRLTSVLIPPYQNPTPLERAVHQWGKPLVWLYWRLVETLLFFQCRLGSRFGTRVSLLPDKPIEIDAFGESTMLPKPAFYTLARQGVIVPHRTNVAGYRTDGLELDNGASIDIDVMVLATGWNTDLSFLSEDVRQRLGIENDGFYLYRHIAHPDLPGLYFVGRASTVSSILTYSLQAHWLAALLPGAFQLPSTARMHQEIADMKAWKRAWMPFSAARSARLIAHMQHYHDELLRDFGASPLRKTGIFAPLKELVAPYEPSHYAGILSRAQQDEIESR